MSKFFLLISLVLSFIFLSQIVHGQVNKGKPNIIIFLTDDQGYADVGFNGNEIIITPELDRLSKEGLTFDRCYTSPVCSPTRAGLLTGRYPTRAGVFFWGHTLRPQEQTIAEILQSEGYQTAFFGKWHLGSIRKDQSTNPGAFGFDTWYAAANFYDDDPWMSHNGTPIHLEGESSMVTVNLAVDYIRKASQKDDPFLVFIWTGSPHLPHQAAESLRNLYPDQTADMQNYMGEITGIDHSVGVLREELKNLNIDTGTILWFSSDNGGKLPQANNGDFRNEKGSLYEGGIRVPAIMYWPGHIKPGITNLPVSTIDLLPTFIEMAGIDRSVIRHPIDGASLVPLLENKNFKRKQPLAFWVYPEIKGHGMKSDQIIQDYQDILQGKGDVGNINDGLLNSPEQEYIGLNQYPYSGTSVWMDGRWKMIQTEEGMELYNLDKDPYERKDLVSFQKRRVSRMKKDLRSWQESVIRSIKGEDYH